MIRVQKTREGFMVNSTGFRNASLPYIRLLILLFVVIPMVFPVVWMAGISLKAVQNGQVVLSFANYFDVLQSGPFARYFFNSILVAVLTVAGNVVFCLMVAYAFARKTFPLKNLSFAVLLGCIMIPKQVLMIPMFILLKNLGMFNTYYALVLPFLVDVFNVFLLKQYIQFVPVELENAARIDGAGDWSVLFRIVMPLCKPAIGIVIINTFLTSWNSFIFPLIFTNSEDMRTLPVGLALFSQGEHSVDWGHLMAGSSIATIPVLIVFLIFQRQIIDAVAYTGMKD